MDTCHYYVFFALNELPTRVCPRPQDRRRFARVRPAGLVSKTGLIIVDPQEARNRVHDRRSLAGGACIDVADPSVLPKRLVLLHGRTKKSCLVMWRTRRRIGVQF